VSPRYIEYRYRLERDGTYSVFVVSTLTGDIKESVDSGLTQRQAVQLCKKLNLTVYDEAGRVRENPPLTVFSVNPPRRRVPRLKSRILAMEGGRGVTVERVGEIGNGVHCIRYTHADDGLDYEHVFETEDVKAIAVMFGSRRAVLLVGSEDIWDDY